MPLTPKPYPVVTISVWAPLSREGQDWRNMLLRMYAQWARHHRYAFAPTDRNHEIAITADVFDLLQHEAGTHTLTRISPFDSATRRHVSPATVTITRGSEQHASTGDVRKYVLQPYQAVTDLRTGITVADAQRVLNGDVDAFLQPTATLGPRVWRVRDQWNNGYLYTEITDTDVPSLLGKDKRAIDLGPVTEYYRHMAPHLGETWLLERLIEIDAGLAQDYTDLEGGA